MTRTLGQHAQAAAAIRKHLKVLGFKATVRSMSYAGGDSVTVELFPDLSPQQVKEVTAYCMQFQYGHFDGMTDYYNADNRRADLPQTKYVFVRVHYSDELKQRVAEYVAAQGIATTDVAFVVAQERALRGVWGDFWLAEEQRKKGLTKDQYVANLVACYRQANLSDSAYAQPWQNVDDSAEHCRAIAGILRGMMPEDEFNALIDAI